MSRKKLHKVSDFLIQSLEERLLFAVTPASPTPGTLGSVFNSTQRQTLLNRLTNLSSTERSTLQTKLNTGPGAFDTALATYFQTRTNTNFFFDPSDVATDSSFITTNHISYSSIQANADAVTNSHLFPDQTDADTFTVQLPASIDWTNGTLSTNTEFLHALNRQGFWEDLSQSAVITGDPKYAAELAYEIASWSQQYQTMNTPTSWSATDQQGWLLDTSIRTENMIWTYFTMLDNSGFSSAEDSLFVYKMLQEGDFLYSNALTTTDFGSNRTISLAKSLLYMGELFPEIDNAAKWETTARNLLFKCMDTQLYADGSDIEQSPGYTDNVAEDLLEARQLDNINGNSWPAQYANQLTTAVDSYWEMLSPDGTRPAIGDTYRTTSFTLFLKADLVQGYTGANERWPASKPRVRDVFMFGGTAVTPYLSRSVSPALGDRGSTYAMQDSGNYVMRSGQDADANQIIFDAGPKGGVHGHYDLLSFELYGGGRPLISDPGAYQYGTSADRNYVISTKAHNTVNVDGLNTGDLEGADNPSIDVSQWDPEADSSQITATQFGYEYLPGQPVLTRSMWYDLNGTILIVDWGQSTSSHTYQQSFNLQVPDDPSEVSVDAANYIARTRYTTGENVQIQDLSRPGQTAAKGPLTFVTNNATGDYMTPAYRYTVTQSGSFVVFVTLITTYNSLNSPGTTTASLLNTPVAGGMVRVQLTENGVPQEVDFSPPALQTLNATATSRGTYNDIAFDKSGNLFMAYFDRDTEDLMYAVRNTSGTWSIPQIVDTPVSLSNPGDYEEISLTLDNNGVPGIAYFDGWNGDLKYAYMDPIFNSWQIQTVDSKGSTGLYPQLAYSRGNGPVISYYNRTKGDLDLAQSNSSGGFDILTVDSTGDVGRFSSLMLDPNRPTATKWAIGYEDTANGNYKYAIQGLFAGGTQLNGYTNYTVDNLAIGGGYVSLAFYDSHTSDTKRYKPAMSYYDAGNSALRYAYSVDSGANWVTQTVASKNVQGLYTQLFFDSTGRANIFYFDRTDNEAIRAVLNTKGWTFTNLGSGGREIHVSVSSTGAIAYTNLDESVGELNVEII